MTTSVPSHADQPILTVRNLSVAFGRGTGRVVAVRNVSIDVPRGRTIAVVGESGSGKSTTAAAINGLLPGHGTIVGGEVLFDGTELTALSESRMRAIRGAQIGLVPQDPMSNLNPLMRIGDQIAEALEVHGRSSGAATAGQVVELLDMVGIDEPRRRVNQYPHEFSGGMRQRVLIAIGLACRPRLLIADEPTSALDVTVQRKILDRLAELTAEMGTSVFLITHDLGLAAERADEIAVMFRGSIVERGPAAQILDQPRHDYTRSLLEAAPSLSTRRMVPPVRTDAPRPVELPPPLVAIEHLVKSFVVRGRRRAAPSTFLAVDDVSLRIPHGQTVSIVGESGSGKSTTANVVLGLEPATSGAIVFDGTDTATMDKAARFAFRRRVQPVFQNPYASLDPRYTVARSVIEPMKVHHVGSPSDRRDRVGELLDQVALPRPIADRYPHELSGGQQQRVAIARALALSPDLVVLDEAVSALDVLVQAQILELLADLQRRLRLSYLFISHDLAVVRMISHHVHVMERGRVVESGPPDQIFDDPQTAYTRELLHSIPGARAPV